jgi:hypothetical protein
MDGRSVPCEVLEDRMKRYGDALACRESRVIKSTSAIPGIHIWQLKGYSNGGRHEPVGLVCRAEYAMSKAARSALGVDNLEWLNSAAQSGYASGSPLVRREQGRCIYGSFWWVLRCGRDDQDQCVYLPDTAYEERL